MWPLDASGGGDVLLLGRHAAQRWRDGRGGLVHVASSPLQKQGNERLASLTNAIDTLLATAPDAARVTVVLESYWMPLMLVPTAGLLRPADVEALVRHRLSWVRDDPADPVGEWDVRIDHRAGEAWALGYGLSPRVRHALEATAHFGRQGRAALLPAWAWGWHKARPDRRWSGDVGHWTWQEQDRMLIASFHRGRPVALNAAAEPCSTSGELASAIERHCLRFGLQTATQAVVATTWQAPNALPAGAERIVWHGLADTASRPVVKAGVTT